MTANRWWVRMAARWLARVDGVSGQLRLAMLAMTGLSTATLTLRSYGHGGLAWPFIGITLVGMAVYTYLYSEGGVWNQVQRDKSDLATNWSGPSTRINTEVQARGIVAGLLGEKLSGEHRDTISGEIAEAWGEYREGVDLDES